MRIRANLLFCSPILRRKVASVVFKRVQVYGTPLGQMEEDLEQAGGEFDHKTGRVLAGGCTPPTITKHSPSCVTSAMVGVGGMKSNLSKTYS